MAIALRYVESLVDGEALAALANSHHSNHLARLRNVLALQGKKALERLEQKHERDLSYAKRAVQTPDHLSALMMQRVGGRPFQDALEVVLRRRGLRMDAVDVPTEKLWEWLAGFGIDPTYAEDNLPAGVRRLRQLNDDAFLQVLLTDAWGTQPNDFLKHHAVVERWASRTKEVEARLRETLEQAAYALARTPARARTQRQRDRLTTAILAYAFGCARSLQAALILKGLRVRVMRAYHQPPLQQLRAECLKEAAAMMAEAKTGPTAVPAQPPIATDVDDGTESVDTDDLSLPDDQAEKFVCEEALARLPTDKAYLVVVVEARSQPDTSLFGYAWLTEDGELRTGTDHSFGVHDSFVQAVCRAALDLDNGKTRIHIGGSHVRPALRTDPP